MYNRCKVSCEDSPDHECCQGLEDGQGCLPSCQKNFHRFESALLADVGFYRKFEVVTNGRPTCDAMVKGDVTLCDKEDHAPEGNMIFSWFSDDMNPKY